MKDRLIETTGSETQPAIADNDLRAPKLADEILQAQKQRGEFLKWKLVLVAALGSAGFGLGDKSDKSHLILLGLVPFVCLYVDLLCYSINLRILVIGSYFKSTGCNYEKHAADHRTAYGMEDWALYGSTYAVSIIVTALGGVLAWQEGAIAGSIEPCLLLAAGLGGLLLTRWAKSAYKKKAQNT